MLPADEAARRTAASLALWRSHGVSVARYAPHGLLPPALRLPSFLDERGRDFRPQDTCFVVSEKYRFIYVKLQKNAGSSQDHTWCTSHHTPSTIRVGALLTPWTM